MQKRVIFRLPDRMFEQVKQAIQQGIAKNTSELVRTAVQKYLREEGV